MKEETKMAGKTIINVCGKADAGKTTGIKKALGYYAKSNPTPKMNALQERIYEQMTALCRTECFEILLINGKRVGFFSKGDVPQHVLVPLLMIFFFECDIIVVASHPNGRLRGNLDAIAGHFGKKCEEVFSECEKGEYDPTLAKKIKEALEKALRA